MTAIGGWHGVVALTWFVVCWAGYTLYADWIQAEHGLMGATSHHRRRWMEQMIQREMRMTDAALLALQSRSAAFFAQTTVFILGGLVALLGAQEKAAGVVAEVPFAVKTGPVGWEIKIGLLAVIFIYAFFKFTWSIRQFNYVAMLIGAAAPANAGSQACEASARRAGSMGDLAVSHFNEGVRGYYFGLAALGWFVHPWLLIAASTWVVLVLWRREFHSRTLAALRD
jgi:uncharacterized membrane protein